MVFLPFSDKVYRVFDVQPLDVLAVMFVVKNCGVLFKGGRIPVSVSILPMLLLSGAYGYWRSGDFFGILYALKFYLAIIFCETLMRRRWAEVELLGFLSLYRNMFLFSVIVVVLQVILWFLGMPISGIFYQVGLIRAKGLAHEPSTFGMWLVFSLPFLVYYHVNHERRIGKIYVTVAMFLVGMMLTSSILALASVIVLMIAWGILNFRRKPLKIMAVGLVLLLGAASSAVYFNEQVEDTIVPKVASYINEMMDPNAVDESGRGGDRQLVRIFHDNPHFGIGAFRSSRLFENAEINDVIVYDFIPAANTVLTTLVEFGVVGLICWVIFFFLFLRNISRYIIDANMVFVAGLVAWLFSMLGARLLAFYQPWLIVALIAVVHGIRRQGNAEGRER